MKRKGSDHNDEENEEKRSRYTASSSSSSSNSNSNSSALISLSSTTLGGATNPPSCLESPSMLLSGHLGAVSTVAFDSSGDLLASASKDNGLFVWNIRNGCSNDLLLRGHTNAITDCAWMMPESGAGSQGYKIISSSADKTVAVWDAETGQLVQRIKSASNKVINAVSPCRQRMFEFASVSDDGLVKIWDTRAKRSLLSHEGSGASPLLSVASAENSFDIYVAGTEGLIRTVDMRKNSLIETSFLSVAMTAEPGIRTRTAMGSNVTGRSAALATITSLSISKDGNKLVSFATDGSLRSWDIRPFCPAGESKRQIALFEGSSNNFELLPLRCSWWSSADNATDYVSCGSVDGIVRVWNADDAKIEAALGGHSGPVLSVAFHPREKIIASGGFDKNIYVSEVSEGLLD